MASGRDQGQESLSSSDDEVDYQPKTKKQKMSTPSAGPSRSAGRDVVNLALSAEMLRLEKKLKAFSKDITTPFPWTRYGSSRDAFCYRQVRGHLGVFKRECLEQCKTFVDANQWKDAIDFILMAWPYVDALPRWDDPNHNKINEQCYKKLTSYLATSLKKGKLEKNVLQSYIGKFQKMAGGDGDSDSESDDPKDNGMLNSIKLARTILQKMK